MLAVTCYITWHYEWFLLNAPYKPPLMLALGTILIVLVMDGLRRVSGWVLFSIVIVFMVYALIAHLVPAPLTGTHTDLDQLAVYLAFDTNALIGIPLGVATTIVVIFIFMGQVLFNTGGGEFFTDIASATMGRRRGGAAKVSVVASALFGSISGSAISNVTTTGVVTIPLMKKSGYSDVDAGAIEANASTGGQFMPPIMGAAAFLMAEFLEMDYADVVIAAIIPALLYYFAIFVQVDLVAARERIKFVADQLPRTRVVLAEGWHFIVPFAVLLYSLYVMHTEAEIAALYAVATIMVLGMVRRYKGRRMDLRSFAASFYDAGIATTELVLIVAAAGFVIGILNKSGGGFALTLFLVKLGGGNLYILLLMAAIICIVLGMGMPTTGVYVLLAALVAPSLVEAGVAKLSAHMFILYFGMMSMITPPIALAAFAAASISRADPMRTGYAAMRMGWVAYVIPFLFVLSPTLIMVGTPWMIALNAATATVGVYIGSVAMTGYFHPPARRRHAHPFGHRRAWRPSSRTPLSACTASSTAPASCSRRRSSLANTWQRGSGGNVCARGAVIVNLPAPGSCDPSMPLASLSPVATFPALATPGLFVRDHRRSKSGRAHARVPVALESGKAIISFAVD